MKKYLALLLLAVSLAVGSYEEIRLAKQSAFFEDRTKAATGAIFVDQERRFNCSGVEIGKIDGDGVFLTARHCAADPETNKINQRLVLSFSDNQGGPFYDAVPVAISSTDDVAILLVRNGADIPEIRIRDERSLREADPIFNVSFPLGTGKQVFHGEYMRSNYPALPQEMLQQYPFWMYAMPINLTIAHGSSGSGIFSQRQQALIGIAVGTFGEGSYNIAIPADRIKDFLNDLKDNTVDKFVAVNPEKESVEQFF
jgi:S1-C subfamily serine protease